MTNKKEYKQSIKRVLWDFILARAPQITTPTLSCNVASMGDASF
jgi:hypothetical protein